MRDAFDVTKFQESLRKLTVSGTASIFNTMTKDQQTFYQNMQGYINKNPLKKTLITAALKRIDKTNSGFVAERDFAQAFIEMKQGRTLSV